MDVASLDVRGDVVNRICRGDVAVVRVELVCWYVVLLACCVIGMLTETGHNKWKSASKQGAGGERKKEKGWQPRIGNARIGIFGM
jgi:hypothetical protein